MSKLVLVSRVLLGLPLLVFGANHLLHFMEPPSDQFTPAATAFLSALDGSGYLMELVGLVQVFAGLTFVFGLFVPLGLVVYAPVMVNIVGFHLFLDDPAKGVVAYVLLMLYVFVSWVYMPSFRGVLAARGETRAKG
jgi:hypothetical protein